MTLEKGQFRAVLLCDDIRREINNKDILIGVYVSKITVPYFPAQLRLAIYAEYMPFALEPQEIFLKIGIVGTVPPAIARIDLTVTALDVIPLILNGIGVVVPDVGELEVAASNDQKVWTTILRRSITKGDVPSIGAPTPPSGVASNP